MADFPCLHLSAFCSALNYAMLGATELLDVALFSMSRARSLFLNASERGIIKDFRHRFFGAAVSI
ncbi:hypothetical protein [Microcoleus sp. bin38.metabat.b11b12b14.051]|uniref:hypothetical protein n=1 Tax=Microcoleus sp. bin38.metabat.b11b12b14.051 TaxID=2742709 RepID=UPI0025E95093|nr:hypothetical protein [Microcoleus sp. bin38.metabat.b11b12b14.051]